jgi:hypothetical protein
MFQAREPFEQSRIEAVETGQLTLDPVEHISLDDRGRLHSVDHEAVRWEDGARAWFIEGVRFDPETWESVVKRTIRPVEAIRLANVEQRRIAIEKLGVERVLSSLAVRKIESAEDHVLHEVQLYDDEIIHLRRRGSKGVREYLPARFLQVKDSTTGQRYFLRVPSGITNCKDAVAWTFGFRADEYQLQKEA